MRILDRRKVIGGLFLAALAAGGCGPRELSKKDVTPTQGHITINGEPVRFALIELEPTDPTVGVSTSGRTDADGRFSLRTYSNEDPDGAVPGEYKLTVTPGVALPPGHKPKTDPPATEVPEELRQPGNPVVIEKDADLEITLR